MLWSLSLQRMVTQALRDTLSRATPGTPTQGHLACVGVPGSLFGPRAMPSTRAATPTCRAERTGRRPSALSRWHREALPWWAWCCDVDLVEVRRGRGIVAVIEHGQVEGRPTAKRARAIAECKRLQLGVIRQIAQALDVAGLFVLHNEDMSRVAVLDVLADTVEEMTGEGFQALLEGL